MSKLFEKQVAFTQKVPALINKAFELGYAVTLGDAYRDPRVHGELGVKKSYSSARSFHKQRLAIDLNLFKDGEYLTDVESHRALGEWWVSVGGTWGGHFRNRDANHYSWGESD